MTNESRTVEDIITEYTAIYLKDKTPLEVKFGLLKGFIRERKWCVLTIELALVISGLSLAFGIWQGFSSVRRNNRKDDREDATQLTTVIVKLENISSGVLEIKNKINSVENDIKESREKIIRLEEAVKQAHKRIDEITKYKRPGDSHE